MKYILKSLIFIGTISFITLTIISHNFSKGRQTKENPRKNLLDGCKHVYLDVGSNKGIQVRKLFEPDRYPKALVHPIFNKYFGKAEGRKENVCAVGFEPNPRHVPRLKNISTSYLNCGFRAYFMTKMGVSNVNSLKATFYTDNDLANNEWGGGVFQNGISKSKTKQSIKLIRLSDFILNVVMKRKIPKMTEKESSPKIVMKIDIEGSELEVVLDLILTGALQHVSTTFIEWHKVAFNESTPERDYLYKLKDASMNLASISGLMNSPAKISISDLDDESYGSSDEPLPKC